MDQKEKINELTKKLEDGVLALRSSSKWQEYLQVQAKMPHYSFNNCLLIMAQTKGQATYCMSYKAWESLDRHVKAGEKALQIICPAPRKITVEKEKRDREGNVILDKNGNPEKEKITKIIPNYKVGYTFDVSQTFGRPLPQIVTRLTGSVDDFSLLKESIIANSPVPVSFESIPGEANGFYSPGEKKIVVDEDLSEKHQIHTLLHEIAHATLDLSGKDDGISREQKEVEAESIAFVCLNHLLGEQADSEELGTYSFGYVAGWSDDNLNEMRKALTVIQQTSCSIITEVENTLRSSLAAKEMQIESNSRIKEMEQTASVTAHRALAM